MDTQDVVANRMESLPTLEIGLKAERVQEPQSLVAMPVAPLVCQLSVQPVQPVSITLDGTTVTFTLFGPGDAGQGEAS